MSEYFPKELVVYCFKKKKNLFLIIISNKNGWSILNLKYKIVIIKNIEIYIYNFFFYFSAYIWFLINIFVGLLFNYTQFIKLNGMGYKMIIANYNLIIKLGFSHRILYLIMDDLRFTYFNKQILKLNSRSLFLIKQMSHMFCTIKKNNMYKKKGIYIKGILIKLKISSKKSKM